MKSVKDKYNRPIISLRITITNNCNINCIYCHHDGMINTKDEMTPNEIYEVCRIAKELGVQKIRLSGGEPLVRKDIIEIVRKISSLDFKDISLTTNGILLKKYAKDLKDGGLSRVNISLDTLNPETYRFITTKNYLKKVKEGIKEAVDVGLFPVKINMVLMKGINENEIDDMFEFCKKYGVILQLIELVESENCEDEKFSAQYHYKLDEVEDDLAKRADKIKTRKFMQDRKKYFIDGGEIEVVKPMDNTDFCMNCTRIRITPDGKIKPCLLRNDNLVDFVSYIKDGSDDEKLKEQFIIGINKREPYNLEK